jgi:hypothetical protein
MDEYIKHFFNNKVDGSNHYIKENDMNIGDIILQFPNPDHPDFLKTIN